ncbi:hypothetical protein O9993_05640 [Vibrio lentus]|nr:hypothetical protein [Vibrio lentus]
MNVPAAVIVERQEARAAGHHQPTGGFLPYPSTSVAAGIAGLFVFSASVVSVRLATGASLLPRHGNGDGLRLAPLCGVGPGVS